MTLLCRIDVPSGKFTIYFVGYKDGGADAVPQDPRDRIEATFDRCGITCCPRDLLGQAKPVDRLNPLCPLPSPALTQFLQVRTCTTFA